MEVDHKASISSTRGEHGNVWLRHHWEMLICCSDPVSTGCILSCWQWHQSSVHKRPLQASRASLTFHWATHHFLFWFTQFSLQFSQFWTEDTHFEGEIVCTLFIWAFLQSSYAAAVNASQWEIALAELGICQRKSWRQKVSPAIWSPSGCVKEIFISSRDAAQPFQQNYQQTRSTE